MISVALNCRRAKVLLPEPEAPMRTTSDNSGTSIFIIAQTPPSGWASQPGGPQGQFRQNARCIHGDARQHSPMPRTLPGTTQNDGRDAEVDPLAASRIWGCIRRWAWSPPRWSAVRTQTQRAQTPVTEADR